MAEINATHGVIKARLARGCGVNWGEHPYAAALTEPEGVFRRAVGNVGGQQKLKPPVGALLDNCTPPPWQSPLFSVCL